MLVLALVVAASPQAAGASRPVVLDGGSEGLRSGLDDRLRIATARHDDLIQGARALARQSLIAQGMPREFGAAPATTAEESTRWESFLARPVGDLNADGTREVLGLSASFDTIGTGIGTVAALDGATGSALWTHTEPSDEIWAWPGNFGHQGRAGILVASYRFVGNVAAQKLLTIQLHLVALDGAGATLWERTFAGSAFSLWVFPVAIAAAYLEYPFVEGTLEATPSPSTEILVDQLTAVDAGYTYHTTDRALVLEGTDGSTVSERQQGGARVFPQPYPVSDYSGDGLDDYLFVERGTPSSASMVHGLTGKVLWRSVAMTPNGWNGSLEMDDATGDGVGELLVWAHPDIGVVSGRDGTLVWQGPGKHPRDAGDVNEDGLADVGVQEAEFRDRSLIVRNAAFAGDTGAQLFATEGGIVFADEPPPTSTTYKEIREWRENVGDVDEDGTTETGHTLSFTYYDADQAVTYQSEDSGIVSGKDGRTLWEPDLTGVVALRATLDGHGADLLRVSQPPQSASVQLEALDGRTGGSLWDTMVNLPSSYAEIPYVVPGDLDGDGRSDLVLTVVGWEPGDRPAYTPLLIDGRTGARRW